jgi:ornithine--oxo-acid transaminase
MVALEGPYAGQVTDVLDASGAYASACLGAGHEVVKRALDEALDGAGYVTDEVSSLERSDFLESLFSPGGCLPVEYSPDEYHVSGRNSGSEGMELALRLVLESRFDRRNLTTAPGERGRRTILVFEGAWHGWTGGVVGLLNRRYFRVGLPEWSSEGPFGIRVCALPFGEPDLLEQFFRHSGSTLAAVVVEPVQGDAGVLVPPPGYLRLLGSLCQEYRVLLVADEVLTFAKTGSFLAMYDEQVVPADITVLGKSLGMGAVSTSLVIARRTLAPRSSGAVSTSDLRPITCALMRRGLQYIVQQDLLARSIALGHQLRRLLRQLAAEFPHVYSDVRGVGLLNGVEVTEQVAGSVPALRRSLIEHGVYLEVMAGAGRRSHGLPYVFPALRVAPPLIITQDDVVSIVGAMRAGTRAFLESGELHPATV